MAEISAFTLLVRAGRKRVSRDKTYTCQLLAVYLLRTRSRRSFVRCAPPSARMDRKVLDIEDRVGEIAERYML